MKLIKMMENVKMNVQINVQNVIQKNIVNYVNQMKYIIIINMNVNIKII